jgi:hypothetical protein
MELPERTKTGSGERRTLRSRGGREARDPGRKARGADKSAIPRKKRGVLTLLL